MLCLSAGQIWQQFDACVSSVVGPPLLHDVQLLTSRSGQFRGWCETAPLTEPPSLYVCTLNVVVSRWNLDWLLGLNADYVPHPLIERWC